MADYQLLPKISFHSKQTYPLRLCFSNCTLPFVAIGFLHYLSTGINIVFPVTVVEADDAAAWSESSYDAAAASSSSA